MTEQPPSAEAMIVRWGVLRLLSGYLASDEERVDAELDLDDFQFWFQENPKHTGFKQILINLSGEQWGKLKELPLVKERSPQPPSALASTGEQPDFARCLRCVSHELIRDVCWYAGRCVRAALQDKIAEQDAERGRPLTDRERMDNLAKFMGEEEDFGEGSV